MKVVIIGSGNVATILGRLMMKNNLQVIQVISRHIEHAKILAEELSCKYTDFNGLADVSADIYIIALADSALTHHFPFLKSTDKIVVHTAGAVSRDILKLISPNYGVIYPLQTLRKEMSVIPEIPLLVDASNEITLKTAWSFSEMLSSNVQFADDATRQKIHVAAVFVNNFTNHLYTIAEDYCQKENVDFGLLKPLIKETAARVSLYSPSEIQTGPAIRKDLFTIEKHLQLLNDYPDWKEIYLAMSNSIMDSN